MTCCIILISVRETDASMTPWRRGPSRTSLSPIDLTTCGWTSAPPFISAGVGRRELDRGDRDALAERSVGEVDLAPLVERRVADDAADLPGEVDPGRLPVAQPEPHVVQDRRRLAGRLAERRARPWRRPRCANRRRRPRTSSSPSPLRSASSILVRPLSRWSVPDVLDPGRRGDRPVRQGRRRGHHLEHGTRARRRSRRRIDEATGVGRGDRLVVVAVVRRVGRLGVDLAGVRVHDDGRDARLARSATQAARSSCSTFSWRPASMVRRRSVPGRAGLADDRVLEHRPAARVALRDDDPRLAGERRLVVLLDAVLAAALAVDEAEQVRGERRARSATDLRIDALGLRLERQAEDPLGVDRGTDPVGRRPVQAVAQDDVAWRCRSAGRAGRPTSASSRPRIRDSSRTVDRRRSGVSWSSAATSRSRWTVVASTTVPVRS